MFGVGYALSVSSWSEDRTFQPRTMDRVAMPTEVSIAGSEQDLSRRVEELERELSESRDQHAATAHILAAISSSPSNPHRAFAEIAAAATRLCDGYNAGIFRLDGDCLTLIAHH